MTIPIAPRTLEETNLLLRALWAQLRSEFGDCRWQFAPGREGADRIIWFGWAQLGIWDNVGFGVAYERKGIATHVLVRRCPDDQLRRIETCVRRAEAALSNPGKHDTPFYVHLFPDLWLPEYTSPSFQIVPSAGGLFTLILKATQGYDPLDALVEAARRMQAFLDAMSFLSNCAFVELSRRKYNRKMKVAQRPAPGPESGKGWPDPPDWIDSQSAVYGVLTLLPEEWSFLERVASNSLAESDHQLLYAAHHFHTGLRAEFDFGVGESSNDASRTETSLVGYMSALEVASLVGASKVDNCPKCGQVQYKISERVTKYVDDHLGPVCSALVKQMYSVRSSYLHAGRLTSSRVSSARIIPQLDPSSPTGVMAAESTVPLRNLREYTSYCLRRSLTAVPQYEMDKYSTEPEKGTMGSS